MSTKSEQFLSPHLRTTQRIVGETKRKTGSMAPPSFQTPVQVSGRAFAAPQRGQGAPETSRTAEVKLSVTLGEAVALVSAMLQAADHALVQAARWETGEDEVRAQQHYARSLMCEVVAERIAKAARNSR